VLRWDEGKTGGVDPLKEAKLPEKVVVTKEKKKNIEKNTIFFGSEGEKAGVGGREEKRKHHQITVLHLRYERPKKRGQSTGGKAVREVRRWELLDGNGAVRWREDGHTLTSLDRRGDTGYGESKVKNRKRQARGSTRQGEK